MTTSSPPETLEQGVERLVLRKLNEDCPHIQGIAKRNCATCLLDSHRSAMSLFAERAQIEIRKEVCVSCGQNYNHAHNDGISNAIAAIRRLAEEISEMIVPEEKSN